VGVRRELRLQSIHRSPWLSYFQPKTVRFMLEYWYKDKRTLWSISGAGSSVHTLTALQLISSPEAIAQAHQFCSRCLVCFGAMLLAPSKFLNWWWD